MSVIKVISFDLDDTLCDTKLANEKGLEALKIKAGSLYPEFNAELFAHRYNEGIHRRFSLEESDYFLPIKCEESFRLDLIAFQLKNLGVNNPTGIEIEVLQSEFDEKRIEHFDFYPDVKDLLIRLREQYQVVVITNGPTFSQHIKIETVNLKNYVDLILVGGEEPHQKPHASIFDKALSIMNCNESEAIHIGDSYECDVVGASNMGMKSVWVTSLNKTEKLVADYTVESVLSIEAILSELTN